MNNCELYLAYIYSPFSFNLFKKFTLYYNSPKLTNTYKQTSRVIYNRLSQKRFKLVFRVLFTAS